MKLRKSLAATLVFLGCASIVPMVAGADPKEVRREMREGRREVRRERVEAHHVALLHDGYYRDYWRWYRDGRYWNEYDYVNRNCSRNRHDNDDDNDDLMRGIVIGAAVVGVIAQPTRRTTAIERAPWRRRRRCGSPSCDMSSSAVRA